MRDQLRAILVSLHLIAVILMSLPGPAAIDEGMLQDDNLQANFRDWSTLAQRIGVNLTPEDIQDLSLSWGSRIVDTRAMALEPFRPYYTYMGTRQRWQMFGVLNRSPGRIEVATCAESEAEPRDIALGVDFRPTDEGVEITEVLPDGPANWGGVLRGDVLTHVDGRALRSLGSEVVRTILVGTHREWMRLRLIRQESGRSRSKNVNIALCEDEDWERRFVMGSDDADWLRSTIEQERMRAIISSFSWKQRQGHYTAFGRWLVGRATEDFPDAFALGIRMARLDVPEPAELRRLGAIPIGEYYWSRNWRLSRSTP